MFEVAIVMSLLDMAAVTGIFLWTVWPVGDDHDMSL